MTESKRTIGEIVAKDYRAAKVFENHGIDFCCGGNVELSVACTEKGLDLAAMEQELEALIRGPVEKSQNYSSWELPFLIDYIINVHHAFIKDNTAQITAYARKIAEVHGAHHPEVIEIASLFDTMAKDLMAHIKEEEEAFFPAVKRADSERKAGGTPAAKDIEMIRHSLSKLAAEHEEVGDAIHKIRSLANGYAIPDDVCNTFMVTYQKLKEFEDDLHKHVHLENNILFQKAVQLGKLP
ncbi:MAG: iron-sulfur cluster repair di-iron protein [Desulfocapsaceae bacterium]|nr:iron-sulfur cluster repair di-iron protein [Desulfocapsaceae bacterium]